jgi:hypothetical protein
MESMRTSYENSSAEAGEAFQPAAWFGPKSAVIGGGGRSVFARVANTMLAAFALKTTPQI